MYVHLNGALMRKEDASIHYQDRGFRFGDGVFETIRIHESIPYLLEAHIHRLQSGLDTLGIEVNPDAIEQGLLTLIQHNHLKEGLARLTVSRGVGSRGYLPTASCHATILIETMDLLPPTSDTPNTLYVSELRRIPPACLPTHFKLNQGLNSTLAKMEAHQHDCCDALQLSVDNYISECSSANILWAKGNTMYAPSLDTGCLAGITASQLFKNMPWKLRMGRYRLAHLLKADAILITNSAFLVKPIDAIQVKSHTYEFPKSHALAQRCRVFFEQNMAQYALDVQKKSRDLM
jgi:4-amino-4-deoxychorismate lyase